MADLTASDAMALPTDLDARLERHRVELTGFCYRMLGSGFEAEDAVQETLLRAWRRFDRFDESRGPLKSWLFGIASNVCLDMLRSAQRRARAIDLGPSSYAGQPLGAPLPETSFVQPIPDSRVLSTAGDPAEVIARRESVRLAFVAALQQLPPRQRAVLILRDVLAWKADEVAELLESTVAAVNSALQRARATLAARPPDAADVFDPLDKQQRSLLERYANAFERHDVETLISLLHEDAKMSMPPFAWWLRGHEEIRKTLLIPNTCHGSRMIPTVANGLPALAHYFPSDGGGHHAFALVVMEISAGLVVRTTSYLDPERLFPMFDLPPRLEA